MFSVCPHQGGGGNLRYLPPAKVPTPQPRYLLHTQPGQNRGGGTPRYQPPQPRYLPSAKVPTTPPSQVRTGEGYPKVPTPPPTKVPTPLPPVKVPTLWPGQDGEGVPQGTYPPWPRYLPTPSAKVPTPLARSGWGRGYPKVPTHLGQGTYPLPPVRSALGVGGDTPRYLPPS